MERFSSFDKWVADDPERKLKNESNMKNEIFFVSLDTLFATIGCSQNKLFKLFFYDLKK